jgi:hypothetical protein
MNIYVSYFPSRTGKNEKGMFIVMFGHGEISL